jgi:predicted Zn-dependent protease
MNADRVDSPAYTIETLDPLRATIEIRTRRDVGFASFALVWSLGWMLHTVMILSAIWHQPVGESLNALYFIRWLMWWIIAGAIASRTLFWMAAGRPETIAVSEHLVVLTRGCRPFARTNYLPIADITNVRPATMPTYPSIAAMLAFWTTGRGRISIDVRGIAYECGSRLTEDDAQRIIGELRRRLSLAEGLNAPAERASRSALLRRIGLQLATFTMAPAIISVCVAGIVFPANALAMDFQTCTAGAFTPKYEPLDKNALRREGIVYLVPFDGFSLAAAESLATHYRTEYQIPVEVRDPMPVPASAYDVKREQLNSSVLLASLASNYPPGFSRTVVIGLTERDMYSPELPWRYTFSMREGDRFGIVSTARMDYGCLGLVQAGSEQQHARLRKMVGKDLGVLYFRLDQSNNPGSMMYSDIGGAQELDRMTEEF